MKTIMVRYQVKPEAAATNEALIGKVFEQLAREQPAGTRYQVFKLEDGVSFVHISSSEGDGPNPLTQLAAFREFAGGIKERCAQPPVTVQVNRIGTYGDWT